MINKTMKQIFLNTMMMNSGNGKNKNKKKNSKINLNTQKSTIKMHLMNKKK